MHKSTSDFINLTVTDSDLSKVRSFDKRTELFNILHSEDADHYSRLYLVGFLKHVGYALEEICDIIHLGCLWSDYNASVTWCHVSSVFRGSGSSGDISSRFTKGVTGGNALQRVSPSLLDYEARYCVFGTTQVKCYFKKCDRCPIVDGGK